MFKLYKRPFNAICNSSKTVEIRANKENLQIPNYKKIIDKNGVYAIKFCKI